MALSSKQVQAVIALLLSDTQGEAAKSVGVSRRTLVRWLQLPEFQQAQQEASLRIYEEAIDRIRALTADARLALAKVLRDPKATNRDRTVAADRVLHYADRLTTYGILIKRIEVLEAAADEGVGSSTQTSGEGQEETP
jgi:hypothetical protein